MFHIGRSRPLVGLDLGSTFLRAVILGRRRAGWALVAARQVRLADHGGGHDGPADAPARQAVLHLLDGAGVSGGAVATALSGHAVIVRRVTVAAASRAELPAAVAWEAEQYLPFDPADVHIAWDVIDSDAARGTIDILLVAARKTSIADRVSLFDGTGYPPVIVDAEACALTNAYLANYSDDDSGLSLLVHAGRRMTTVCLVADGEPQFARDVSAGIQIHIDALLRELSPRGIDEDDAVHIVEGGNATGVDPADTEAVLREASAQLTQAIRKTVEYHGDGLATAGANRILLSGGACLTPGLAEVLGRELGAPVEYLDPFRRIARTSGLLDPALPRPAYAVAVGLAMRQGDRR